MQNRVTENEGDVDNQFVQILVDGLKGLNIYIENIDISI